METPLDIKLHLQCLFELHATARKKKNSKFSTKESRLISLNSIGRRVLTFKQGIYVLLSRCGKSFVLALFSDFPDMETMWISASIWGEYYNLGSEQVYRMVQEFTSNKGLPSADSGMYFAIRYFWNRRD